jgi:twinkle protein
MVGEEEVKQMPQKKENYNPPKTQPVTPSVLKWFADRGISEDTVRHFRVESITFSGKEWAAIPFYYNGEIVNWKYRSITDKDFRGAKDGMLCAFNIDSIQGHTIIAVTEGELDAMATYEAGIHAVISCPNGAPPPGSDRDAKTEFLHDTLTKERLASVETVMLAMDFDEPGIPYRNAIGNTIGAEKCRIVKYPHGCKDANDVLIAHGKEVLMENFGLAKAMPIEGLTSYKEHEDEIIQYMRSGGGAKGLSTGWLCLDKYLKVTEGQMMIITGVPQSGKSEWMDALMLNMIRNFNWKWAIYSPENYPIPFHFQKLAEKWTGMPMFPKHEHETKITEDVAKGTIRRLNEHIIPMSFGENGADLDSILSRARVCVEKFGIKGFLLDPYNEVEHKRPAGMTETEYISQFLTKIRTFGRLYGVLMCIVAHPTKLKLIESGEDAGKYPIPSLYDISGSANWRNKADIGVSIWRDLQSNGNGVTVAITKMRNKNLGETGKVQLYWNWHNGRFEETQIQ